MSWKSGARAIDKSERQTVVAGTLKQELLKRQYVVFGSECVNLGWGFSTEKNLPLEWFTVNALVKTPERQYTCKS